MNMLSKSQFVVYPSLDIRQVTAVYEEGKDFPVCFFLLDEKDWFNASAEQKFFDTEEEAKQYAESRFQAISLKAREVREFIEFMKGYYPENEAFEISKEDYLGDYDCSSDYYKQRYEVLCDEINLLKTFIRYHFLNINSHSISVAEVSGIRWFNQNHAEICYGDGKAVMTRTEAEYSLIETVFGSNFSGLVFVKDWSKEGKEEKK